MKPFASFLEYLRLKIGLSASLIALLGFTLNNGALFNRWKILVAALLMTIAVYSFNLRTDFAEDLANGKIVNKYSASAFGLIISLGLAFLAVLIASQQQFLAQLMLWGSGSVGFVYSISRWKDTPHLKNLSIAFGFVLIHLFGILSAGTFTLAGIVSTVTIFLAIFGMGLLADMRDYEGDSKIKVPTYPVLFGMKNSEHIVLSCFILLICNLVIVGADILYYLMPFVIGAIIVIRLKTDYALAHHYMRIGIILTSLIAIFKIT